jgi:hypothetical protein
MMKAVMLGKATSQACWFLNFRLTSSQSIPSARHVHGLSLGRLSVPVPPLWRSYGEGIQKLPERWVVLPPGWAYCSTLVCLLISAGLLTLKKKKNEVNEKE